MAINKPIKKRELRKTITTANKSHLRISGWCKTYEDLKEFGAQREKYNSIYINTEVSINN